MATYHEVNLYGFKITDDIITPIEAETERANGFCVYVTKRDQATHDFIEMAEDFDHDFEDYADAEAFADEMAARFNTTIERYAIPRNLETIPA